MHLPCATEYNHEKPVRVTGLALRILPGASQIQNTVMLKVLIYQRTLLLSCECTIIVMIIITFYGKIIISVFCRPTLNLSDKNRKLRKKLGTCLQFVVRRRDFGVICKYVRQFPYDTPHVQFQCPST